MVLVYIVHTTCNNLFCINEFLFESEKRKEKKRKRQVNANSYNTGKLRYIIQKDALVIHWVRNHQIKIKSTKTKALATITYLVPFGQ